MKNQKADKSRDAKDFENENRWDRIDMERSNNKKDKKPLSKGLNEKEYDNKHKHRSGNEGDTKNKS
jgi:hypothetical protein